MRYPFLTALTTCAAVAALPLDAPATEAVVSFRTIQAPLAVAGKLAGSETDAALLALSSKKLMESGDSRVRTEEMRYLIKGSKVRIDGMDAREPGGFAVIDTEAGTVDMVMPSKKQVVRTTRSDAEQMGSVADAIEQQMAAVREQMKSMGLTEEQLRAMPGMPSAPAPKPAAKVRDTGIDAELGGVKTHAWDVDSGPELTRAWVTREHAALLPTYRAINEQFASMSPREEVDEQALLADHGMIWRSLTIQRGGRGQPELSIGEVVGVDYTAVAAEKVTTPGPAQGYEIVSAGEMMQRAMPPGAAGTGSMGGVGSFGNMAPGAR